MIRGNKPTFRESVSRWNARPDRPRCAAPDCQQLAYRFHRYCHTHQARVHVWGSPSTPPKWQGSPSARRAKRKTIENLIRHELERANPVVRSAVDRVARWIADARREYAKAGGEHGMAWLPPKRRSWIRLWQRIGEAGSAERALAYVLLLLINDNYFCRPTTTRTAGFA